MSWQKALNLDNRMVLSRHSSRPEENRRLKDNGILILGSAEDLYNITDRFRSEQVDAGIVYRKG